MITEFGPAGTLLAGREARSRRFAMPEPVTSAPAPSRWLPAIAVMLSAVMEVLDTSVVNVSLPHISGSLSATVDESTWVLTSYIVANAIILPISGWLASYFGRKRLLLTVITGFTLSSVLCGMAPTLGSLIFFRILQGTTGGGLQPLSQAVLLESFPVEERGKAMAVWGMGIVAAPVLGPAIGGWLTDNYSWRWVFYINLPVGILSLVMTYLFIRDPPYLRRVSRGIDFWGLGLLVVGMGALQVMFDQGQEKDWFSSSWIMLLAVVAAVGLTVFVVHQLLTDNPLVDFRLLRQRTFAAGVFVVGVLGFVLYGSLVLLPLFMQTLLGFPAVVAGLWSMPRGLGTMLCMPVTGWMLGRRWDPRLLLGAGLVTVSAAFFLYSGLDLDIDPHALMWPQVVQGIGLSLVFVPLSTIAMDPIPLESMGFATSIFSLVRNVGASMGISFVTTELARRSQMHQSRLAESVSSYGLQVQSELSRAGSALGQALSPDSPTGLRMIYAQVQRQASAMSFLDLFYVLGLLFLAIVPVVWLMRRPQHRRAGAPAH
jgi:MFS transporter, DHA2 family, multidrug resistance protein